MSGPQNPYSTPRSFEPSKANAGSAVPRSSRYRSAVFRSRVAALMLVAIALSLGVCIVSDVMELSLLNEANLRFVSDAEWNSNDIRQLAAAVVYLVVLVITVISFCMWKHRAYKNLPSLRAWGLQYSPGWAVGFYFIPIINLFRPYQAMQEINNHSVPKSESQLIAGRGGSPAPAGVWWTFWILFNLSSNAANRLRLRADSIDEMINADYFSIAANGLGILAAVLAALVVLKITANQEAAIESYYRN